jgi:hypothetical protein
MQGKEEVIKRNKERAQNNSSLLINTLYCSGLRAIPLLVRLGFAKLKAYVDHVQYITTATGKCSERWGGVELN